MKKFKVILLALVAVISLGILGGCSFTQAYDVTIHPPVNGTVSVSSSKAFKGDIITITAIPNDGYLVKSVQCNNQKINGYSFEMPAQSVIVAVEFSKGYTVRINEDSDGVFTLDKTYTYSGDVVTVNVAEEYIGDYEPSSGIITFTKVSEGVYTFVMPEYNVNISKKIVTYSVSTSSAYTLSKQIAVAGEVITITTNSNFAEHRQRLEIDGVDIHKVADGEYTFVMPKRNVQINIVDIPYTITNTDAAIGNVQEVAVYNSTVTITISDPLYKNKLAPVVNNGAVEVSGENGTYTFTMPEENVVITYETHSYNITFGTGAEGKFTVQNNVTKAQIGDTITIYVNDDYLDSHRPAINGVELTKAGTNVYTFVMPEHNVVILPDDLYIVGFDNYAYYKMNFKTWRNRAAAGDVITIVMKIEYMLTHKPVIDGVEVTQTTFTGTVEYTFVMPAHEVLIGVEAIPLAINNTRPDVATVAETGTYEEVVTITMNGETNKVTYFPVVKDSSNAEVEVTKKTAGTYTFAMPNSAVTITYEAITYLVFIDSDVEGIVSVKGSADDVVDAKVGDTVTLVVASEYVGLMKSHRRVPTV